jgi:pyruvate dehydrogenase kinase 2/3/4
MSWKKTEMLMDTIKHYSGFPATGVSLRQMVQFGERPSTGTCIGHGSKQYSMSKFLIIWQLLGTLFKASQFLSEELPIRLAHRVQELGDLPDGLNEMPSIKKVQDWYAQSFEVRYILHCIGFKTIC